jgi:hypothetical protein
MRLLLFACFSFPLCGLAQQSAELAGNPSDNAPYFTFHQTHNGDQEVYVGVDPAQFNVDGESANLYITQNKTAEEWASDPALVDVRGASQLVSFSGVDISETTVLLTGTSGLENYNGARPGVGYDIVVDLDQDGNLSASDLIDGAGDEAGFYLVGNMFEPGPYEVDTAFHSTSFWHTMRVYYPSNLQELEAQPLVVISHGWTHEYWFYDYLGEHLASYGYVVMAHRNEVGNGGAMATETASTTALENIDEFLTHVDSIGGGVLAGRVNKNLIIHTGHSTGGECVVRAYKRLFDGTYLSPFITHENIVCVSSLAPVAFLPADATSPEGCNYHQFLAAADTDVSGAAEDNYVQAFSIYERGYGNKQITYIHGAGHSDFHGAEDILWGAGPNLIGKEAVHTIVKPYFLALCELYSRNSLAMKEFFSRNRNAFRPSSIDPGFVVSGEYRDAETLNMVIDDFQANESLVTSSSAGAVTSNLGELHEVLMQDFDGSFEWSGEQWNNGMCRARYNDDPMCASLAWEENSELSFEVVGDLADWTSHDYLSFRACQLTRHPLNADSLGIAFEVSVKDAGGNTSTLSTDAYGRLLATYPKGTGGYLSLCLEEGTYSVVVGGSQWESEMSFSIPGYIEDASAGVYELVIGAGDPCTEIEVFMYDSWGDGWDDGLAQIFDENEVVVGEGTLLSGTNPEVGVGWQNEFYTYRLPLADFRIGNNTIDFSNMAEVSFQFGPSHGSSTGAIGLDDVEVAGGGLSYVASIFEEQDADIDFTIYPNPTASICQIRRPSATATWSYVIYNYEGKEINSQFNISSSIALLDVRQLESGMYVVVVNENGKVATRRLVVQ